MGIRGNFLWLFFFVVFQASTGKKLWGEITEKKIGAWKFDAKHSALVLDNMSLMAHKVNKKYDEIISTFLSRPLLLSWIKANSNETMTKLYSEYHVDQLTSDDSTSFHYTAVIYLDNESYQFHGGHLQFGDGSIYTPRFYEVESV